MKITYEFADGTRSVVEVDEEIGEFIEESRRQEENLERKERYHCLPLFDENDKCLEIVDWKEPYDCVKQNESEQKAEAFLNGLTETQRRRIEMKLDGLSIREIARREGVALATVQETLEQVKKKIG